MTKQTYAKGFKECRRCGGRSNPDGDEGVFRCGDCGHREKVIYIIDRELKRWTFGERLASLNRHFKDKGSTLMRVEIDTGAITFIYETTAGRKGCNVHVILPEGDLEETFTEMHHLVPIEI